MDRFVSVAVAEDEAARYLARIGCPPSHVEKLKVRPDRVHGHGGRKGRGKSSHRGQGKRSGKKKGGK